MRIGFGSDQVGFECKERLRARFAEQGHQTEDVSTGDPKRSDYWCIIDELASALYAGRFDRGVLVCASAIGASVAANKRPGIDRTMT